MLLDLTPVASWHFHDISFTAMCSGSFETNSDLILLFQTRMDYNASKMIFKCKKNCMLGNVYKKYIYVNGQLKVRMKTSKVWKSTCKETSIFGSFANVSKEFKVENKQKRLSLYYQLFFKVCIHKPIFLWKGRSWRKVYFIKRMSLTVNSVCYNISKIWLFDW